MADWIVRRWARYGHERLYAETPGGTALGYFDLKTGRYHSDDLTNLPLLQKAIGDHLAASHPALAVTEHLAAMTPAEATVAVWVGGDTFMVNGQRVPYIRNSRHEARRAGKLLTEQVGFPVTATGIIAVVGAQRSFKIKKQPEDGTVVVVQRRRVSQHVQRLPARLTAGEVDAIYDAARRSTTWR